MSRDEVKAFHDQGLQTALKDWWEGLQEDKGGRAELRRARDVTQAALCPAFQRLRWAMTDQGIGRPVRLAVVAMVLAHLKETSQEKNLGQAMARPGPGGKARVSGLRFRRLLQIEEREDLVTGLRRVLALLDGRAPLQSLARDIYFWGPSARKRWAFDYYDHAPDKNDSHAA